MLAHGTFCPTLGKLKAIALNSLAKFDPTDLLPISTTVSLKQ
ncbi:hypothetical protein [Nostoc sp. NIES-3756]|nr:hypothetical protein [Nostoc sp. NIES-3756]